MVKFVDDYDVNTRRNLSDDTEQATELMQNMPTFFWAMSIDKQLAECPSSKYRTIRSQTLR